MSQRRPYPFDAIEAKWHALWMGPDARTLPMPGQVSSNTLREAWRKCLAQYGLQKDPRDRSELRPGSGEAEREFGRDAVRMAILSLPTDQGSRLPTAKELAGANRILARTWRRCVNEADEVEFEQSCTMDPSQRPTALDRIGLSPSICSACPSPSVVELQATQRCLQRVDQGISQQRPYLAVAALAEFINEATSWSGWSVSALTRYLVLLQPFAPVLAHELRGKLRSVGPATTTACTGASPDWEWPSPSSKLLTEGHLEISIQINGKWRESLMVSPDLGPSELERAALSADKIVRYLAGRTVRKVVVIPNKLVNIAVE